jgi:AcrR family transcriptional regulator
VSSHNRFADALSLLKTMGDSKEPGNAKARTRSRILRAATGLFERRGYRHTSLEEVARESGIAKGTVYVHFKNKAELLVHVLAEEKKRYVERFLPLFSEPLPPAERLQRYIELALLAIAQAPLISKMMNGDREILFLIAELGPEWQQQFQAQESALTELLKGVGHLDQLSAAKREERAKVLKGLFYTAGPLMDERVRGGLSPEQYARQLAKMIVEGIGAP